MCTMHVYGVLSGQMPDSLELELQTLVSCLVRLRVKSKNPLEEQPVPVTAELSLQSLGNI